MAGDLIRSQYWSDGRSSRPGPLPHCLSKYPSLRHLSARLLLAAVVSGVVSTLAFAGIDRGPRTESVCQRDGIVYRPDPNEAAVEVAGGTRTKMIAVTICRTSRRICFVLGDEAPMARCRDEG